MYMFKYVCKRLGLMIFTFLIIMVICFTLVKMLPLPNVREFGKDMELIQMRREQLGYNKPILVQLALFAKSVVTQWNWGVGETLYTGREVAEVFASKLPASMLVNLYSMLFSVPIGLLFGIFAALKKNKWQDHLISTGTMIFVSVPSYVYAFLVQYIFSFRLGWLPFQMEASYDYFTVSMFVSLIAPILSLSFGTIAGLTRYTRAELTEVLTSDFMLLARTKGLTRRQATTRHALRNAMVPILPMIIGGFIDILSGSIVIESIFTIPGVGNLYINSIQQLDYNFFMLLSAFYTFVGLLANIVVDISYGFIDPRIRMGAK